MKREHIERSLQYFLKISTFLTVLQTAGIQLSLRGGNAERSENKGKIGPLHTTYRI